MIPMYNVRLHGLWLLMLVSTVDAKTNWIRCDPLHEGRQIVFANDRFILHNNSLEDGYHSKDGLAWTSSRDTGLAGSPSSSRLVFLQGRFHSFSIPMNAAYRTSDDGLHWKEQPLPIPCSFADMTWGQGMFVGVSNCSDGLVATSPDGIDWTTHHMGSSQEWDRICYGNGVFVAMNLQGPIAVSSDAETWKIVQGHYGSGDFRHSQDIRFGNGIFVIVGNKGRTLTSTDGAVWKESTPFDTFGTSYSMLFEEGQFVVIRDRGGAGDGFRSRDGLAWSMVSGYNYGSASLAYGNGRYLAITDGGTAYSDDSAATWKFSPSRKVSYLYGAAHTGQDFIVVGSSGALATSPDGMAWTERDAGVSTELMGVVWGNKRAIVFGTGGTILISTDLAEWSKLIDPRLNFANMVFGGSVFVGLTASGKIFVSTDGASWDSVYAVPAGQKPGQIAYGNGIFLVGDATNPGTLLRSTDGHQWTRVQNDSIRKTLGGFIVYGKDGFLLGESKGAKDTLYRTTDGSDVRPVRVSFPATNFASPFDRPVAYGQGYYMTTVNSSTEGRVVYSADGINWQIDQSDNRMSHGITFGDGKILRLHSTLVGGVSVAYRFDPITTSIKTIRRKNAQRDGGSPGKGMIDATGKARDRDANPAHGLYFIRNR